MMQRVIRMKGRARLRMVRVEGGPGQDARKIMQQALGIEGRAGLRTVRVEGGPGWNECNKRHGPGGENTMLRPFVNVMCRGHLHNQCDVHNCGSYASVRQIMQWAMRMEGRARLRMVRVEGGPG